MVWLVPIQDWVGNSRSVRGETVLRSTRASLLSGNNQRCPSTVPHFRCHVYASIGSTSSELTRRFDPFVRESLPLTILWPMSTLLVLPFTCVQRPLFGPPRNIVVISFHYFSCEGKHTIQGEGIESGIQRTHVQFPPSMHIVVEGKEWLGV